MAVSEEEKARGGLLAFVTVIVMLCAIGDGSSPASPPSTSAPSLWPAQPGAQEALSCCSSPHARAAGVIGDPRRRDAHARDQVRYLQRLAGRHATTAPIPRTAMDSLSPWGVAVLGARPELRSAVRRFLGVASSI